jgi:PAS domain S-box-containing protein
VRKTGAKHEQGFKKLRNRAEKSLRKRPADLGKSPVEDVQNLIHELRVHQVELEMQNEELRKAQVELAESRDKYFDLYDCAPIGYFTLGGNGLIVEANLAGADLLGFERASLIRKGFSQFVAPGSRDAFYSHRKQALETGSRQTRELKLLKKNGEGFHSQMQTVSVGGNERKSNQLRIAVIDITERKRAEENLRAAHEELERRVEARTAELARANLLLKEEIDQRSLTEHALKESEEKYRIVVENANDGIVVAQDAEFKFTNVKLETISGYSREELTGMPLADLVHPGDRAMVLEYHLKAVEGREEPRVYNLRILDKDGHTKWLRNNRVLIEWGGRPATLNFLTDITAQMHAEQALRETEEQFKNVFLESPIGITVYDSQGLLRSINKSCLEIYGVSDAGRISGASLFSDPSLDNEKKEKLRSGQAVRYEMAFEIERIVDLKLSKTTKAGTKYLDVLITPLGLRQGGSVTGYLAQVQDVTDRKHAVDNIHALSQQLIRANESERQMISRELHDRIGQDLSALKIGLHTLFDDRPEMRQEFREKVSKLSNLIQETIAGIRDLAYDLRPPGLDQLGFVQTISQYCKDFSTKTGLQVDLTCTGIEGVTLDSDAEINLYRLIQEGLNNIHKHAQARRATLRMVASFPDILLRIEDDGIGFDTVKRLAAAAKEKRMGLRSMQERADLLGGKMRIQSRSGKGTKILVAIPYTEMKNGSEEEAIDC